MDKAGRLLDLSRVPPAAQRKIADETFYLLWEVIGRVELPDLAEIPDADVGKNVQENLEQLTRWRIPGTEITIDRIAEGPRAGEFLFSSDTVKQARVFTDCPVNCLTCGQCPLRMCTSLTSRSPDG